MKALTLISSLILLPALAAAQTASPQLWAWACRQGVAKADLERALRTADNDRYIVFADYGLRARSERLFVYDIRTGEVSRHRVTHGLGNAPRHDPEFRDFSSRPGSSAVPGGVHVLGSKVERNERRGSTELLLHGQDARNASSAFRRIALGDCGETSRRLRAAGRVPRSGGSMCLDAADARRLLPKLGGAALVNFDSRRADPARACPRLAVHQGDERSDESFERTESLPMDSDLSQIEIHGGIE